MLLAHAMLPELPTLDATDALLAEQATLKHWRHFDRHDWAHVKDGIGSLVIGSLLPVALFYATYRLGSFPAAVLTVLGCAALVFAWQYRRKHILDVFSATTLGLACVKAAAGLASQNPTLYLAWPSVENLIYGLTFLLSAIVGHPLLALYARRLYPVPPSVEQAATFKRAFLVVSLVWLVGNLVRAGFRLWLLSTFSLGLFLALDTVAGWPISALLVAFAVWYPLHRLRGAGLLVHAWAIMTEMESSEERELKLVPGNSDVLERLAAADRLGPFVLTPAGVEHQTNAYWDTPHSALGAAHIALRRRVVVGARQATWTVKGEGSLEQGLAIRPEINVVLEADTPPVLVAQVMIQAARERGQTDLSGDLADALRQDGPLPAQPLLEMRTTRRLWNLAEPGQPWSLELALDDVRLAGHDDYAEREIEVEIRHGDTTLLETARDAIQALGPVHAATGTKLSNALEHLARCHAC